MGQIEAGSEGLYDRSGFGERDTEGDQIIEYVKSMDLTVCNTLFQKKLSQLITVCSDVL